MLLIIRLPLEGCCITPLLQTPPPFSLLSVKMLLLVVNNQCFKNQSPVLSSIMAEPNQNSNIVDIEALSVFESDWLGYAVAQRAQV